MTVDPLGFTLFAVFAAYVITGRFPFGFDSLNTLARVCTLAKRCELQRNILPVVNIVRDIPMLMKISHPTHYRAPR